MAAPNYPNDEFGPRTYSIRGSGAPLTDAETGQLWSSSNPFPARTAASQTDPRIPETVEDDAIIAALLQAEEQEDYLRRTAVPGQSLNSTNAYSYPANQTKQTPTVVPMTNLNYLNHPASVNSASSGSSGATLNAQNAMPTDLDMDPETWKAAVAAAGLSTNIPISNTQTYNYVSKAPEIPIKKPFYQRGWFIGLVLLLALAAIVVPVVLVSTGAFQTKPEKPPPVWIDWYNATASKSSPNCSLLLEDPANQPTYATFPLLMPAQPVPSLQQTINLNAEYGLDETSADNFQAVQRALSDCRTIEPWRGCRLIMRRGIYRFAAERPLSFDRLTNFTMEGNGSMWLFSRRNVFSRLTAFDSCRTGLIRDLQIDWDWSTFRLASLVQIDSVVATKAGELGQQNLVVRFVDHPFLDLGTINGLQDLHAVDPETLTVGIRDVNRLGQYWSLDTHVLAMEQSYDPARGTNNTVKISLDKPLYPAPDIGGLYLIRHFTYEGHALQFAKCSDFWIDNVKVWGAPGMGLAVHAGSRDFRVTNFTLSILSNGTVDSLTRIENTTVPGFQNITILPTSNFTLSLANETNQTVTHLVIPALTRRISTTADGLNFIGTTGHIHVEDVEVGFQGDDCANANPPVSLGFYRVTESEGSTRLVLRDWQMLRVGGFADGDWLEFRNRDYSPTGVRRRVRGQGVWAQGSGWQVEVEGPGLPVVGDGWVGEAGERWTGSDGGMVVFNLKYNVTSSLLFRRIHCHSNRSRGILFQHLLGAIEHSCFTNIQKRALSVSAEVQQGSWAEGMGVTGLVFGGNKVERCDKLDDYLGVVWTGVQLEDGSHSAYPLLGGIRIVNNTFVNFPRRSIFVESARGVEIEGNEFINLLPDEPQTLERGQILIAKARDVTVNGNRWSSGQFTGARLVSVDPGTTSGVVAGADNVVF